jgi:hypothetical protein
MSVAIRFDRLIPSVMTESTPSTSTPSTYRPRIAEAPDCGGQAHEAPEARRGQSFEAPDAGEGRMGYTECQFTHGRSQS